MDDKAVKTFLHDVISHCLKYSITEGIFGSRKVHYHYAQATQDLGKRAQEILKLYFDEEFGPGPESIREEVAQMGKSSTVSYMPVAA